MNLKPIYNWCVSNLICRNFCNLLIKYLYKIFLKNPQNIKLFLKMTKIKNYFKTSPKYKKMHTKGLKTNTFVENF